MSDTEFKEGEKVYVWWGEGHGYPTITHVKRVIEKRYVLDEKTYPVTYPVSDRWLYKLGDPIISNYIREHPRGGNK